MRVGCSLELRKPLSGKLRGHITVRLEQRSDNTLSLNPIGETLSRLEKDERIQNISGGGGADEEDPVEIIRLFLNQITPFMYILDATSKV